MHQLVSLTHVARLSALLAGVSLASSVACTSTATSTAQPTTAAPAPTVQFENPGGMWVPGQLATAAHKRTLKSIGLELDPASLADPLAYPLGAIVHLGGCSASFVSPDGLIATNHHCVQGALQYNSTPEENRIETGYLAKTKADELWAGATSRVYVTRKITDITAEVRAGIDGIDDPRARYLKVEERKKAAIAACEKGRPDTRCEVAAYDGGTSYRLAERLAIRDVRMVYVPARGIGNYGGEIDNWMWPRHTGDFAFLRAYVAPDGSVADYAKENVPYKPKMWLKQPTSALSEGDLIMVAGYPGRTSRYKTLAEWNEAVDWAFPKRIAFAEEYMRTMEGVFATDADAKVKGERLHRRLANLLKYSRGAVESMRDDAFRTKKEAFEAKVTAHLKAHSPATLDALTRMLEERKSTRDADFAMWEMKRLSGVASMGYSILRTLDERQKPDAARDTGFQTRDLKSRVNRSDRFGRTYTRHLDSTLWALALHRLHRTLGDNTPAVVKALGLPLGDLAATQKTIAAWFKSSMLEDAVARKALLESGTWADVEKSTDPLLKVMHSLYPMWRAEETRAQARAGDMLIHRPAYLAAVNAVAEGPIAPDANSTLRVTYGTVRNNGKLPQPFTTVEGVRKKATGAAPFDAPARLLAAIDAKTNVEAAVHKPLGTVPVDFLGDLDITGGNSGSATLNGRGEIVGLVFDGTYESMASDWVFLPAVTRSIHVDWRYVLWVMGTVDGATHLVDEMQQ